MTSSTCIKRWIAGAFISALVIAVEALPAHASMQSGEGTQDVFLRLESGWDADVIIDFQHRLTKYDAVRRRLDAPLPLMPVAADPATILRVAEAHHGACSADGEKSIAHRMCLKLTSGWAVAGA